MTTKAKLMCKTGTLAGIGCEFDDEITVGKSGECGLRLDPPIISGRHARVYLDTSTNAYHLEDLDSRNGTELDGVRVTRPQRLDHLHVITFAGQFDFLFYAPRPATKPAVTVPIAAAPVEPAGAAVAPAVTQPTTDPETPAREEAPAGAEATMMEVPPAPVDAAATQYEPKPAHNAPAPPTPADDGDDVNATHFEGPPPGPGADNRTMPERPGADEPEKT